MQELLLVILIIMLLLGGYGLLSGWMRHRLGLEKRPRGWVNDRHHKVDNGIRASLLLLIVGALLFDMMVMPYVSTGLWAAAGMLFLAGFVVKARFERSVGDEPDRAFVTTAQCLYCAVCMIGAALFLLF
ncbi:hypothetical protein [Alkalicoccus chagannorensis]|uniref:hypothetical protein n=1 Tax=Alkalicoccus chagannorensis TaxID=427072 RepID=UPI0004132C4B|nr:hypothetical protein [Alkalicoccus chagannorensis]